MPLHYRDIFKDFPASLGDRVNPYTGELLAAGLSFATAADVDSSLPLLHGSNLQGLRGRWREFFAKRHPQGLEPRRLILEIGCYTGRTLAAFAQQQPDCALIGLDITFKRVVLTARRLREAALPQAVAVLGDARQLDLLVEPGELDGVLAFFPDPWQKKLRQRHRRLFSAAFCQKLSVALGPSAAFWFRSDSQDYFAEVQASMQALGFVDTFAPPIWMQAELPSNFAEIFRRQALPTYEARWQRPLSSENH